MDDIIKRILLLKVRKKRRFRIKGGLYVVPGRNQVVDISMGGLSFHYVSDRTPAANGHYHLALLADNQSMPVKFPCRTISDCETGELVFQNQKIRRRSVRFEGLSAAQKTALRDMIKKCR